MNTRLLCVLVALCAMSCAQAWPYMNPYVLSRMLGGLGWGEGGHASRGGFGGFGGGQGGFGNMGGFGGGEGGSHFGAGGGEGGSHFGAGGGEGGAAAAGGDDEAGAAGGEGGAAAGAEGGAPGGAEGAHQFPTAFPMGLGGYGYMGLNQFPGYGYNRMNPFLRTNPFYRFNPTAQPWLMGPNVCRNVTEDSEGETGAKKEEQGEEEIRHHFTATTEVCDKLDTAYKCTRTQHLSGSTKTQVEIYECCHGYTRKPSQFGCPTELKMTDLPGTLANLGLKQLLRVLEGTSMTEELQLGTFTVFAPRDAAFNATTSNNSPTDTKLQEMLRDKVVVVSEPMTSLMLDDMQNLLLGHLVSGMRKTHHFRDEEVVETASPEGEGIRINLYKQPGSSQLMTANCARVLSTDNQATNGIIHTVESVLRPVTDSLTDLVSKNPQLSYLKTAMARANLVQRLREPGQFSLLAPTDTAFRKLKPAQLDRLLRGNPKCLEKVLLNHVLPNVICTAAITGRAKTPNSLHNYLKLSRDQDGKLFVEGSQVIVKDIMATNGVLHLLDDVLVPDEAKDLLEAAQARELTEFLQLVDKAALSQTLTDADNVTVFVPSNTAFESLPEDVKKQLSTSPELLRDVLNYHVVPGARRCSALQANQQLDTLLASKQVRVNEYNSYPFRHDFIQTVQCAPVVERNIPACNGIIHVIDKVMLPPSGDVLDVLSRDSRFTTLVSLLKKAGLAESLQEQSALTVFAPSNQAFENLDRKTLNQVTNNPETLKKVLLNHVTDDVLCCSGFFERSWFSHPRVRMLGGAVVTLDRHRESPRVGNAAILDCDRSATNGVVHLLDSVLVDERPRRYWSGYYDY